MKLTNDEFEAYLDSHNVQYANLGGGDYAVYLNNETQ